MERKHMKQTLTIRQQGVGLIEVLIAVLVLSIGFLGLAALQAKALQNNNSAMTRSMATIASYSILDAMRADPTGVTAGSYDGKSVTVGNCPAAGASLASKQLNFWCAQELLPLGAGSTGLITSLGGGNYRITLTFNDSRATGGNAAQTITTQAKL